MNIDRENITWPSDLPFANVFQIKVTLQETEPPVWRRLVVPESYTLYDLHVAIQDSMGWWDYHLHCFEFDDETKSKGFVLYESPWMPREYEGDDWIVTTEVPIKDHFNKAGDRGLYRYDYGDDWLLEVCLEDVFPKDKGMKYPVCAGGELAGPHEDCGGVDGYYRCIKALEDGDDSEGLLTWLEDWRPDDFSPEKIKFESPRERFKKALGD